MESSDDLVMSPSYSATVFCGFRPGYEEYDPTQNWVNRQLVTAEAICKDYCDEHSFCFTVEPTKFFYKNGWEHGVKVGLINYPRFEPGKELIREHALQIAKMLKEAFEQKRVSIVFDDVTVMLGEK